MSERVPEDPDEYPVSSYGPEADSGPYDADDPAAPREEGALEFGSLRVPMPERAQLQVEDGPAELLRAVHVLVPSGRVSLSALAAPRTSPLWRELAEEIATSLSADGARVRSEWAEWGREVQAGSNGALSRFIGVDGPRWMLYGVATGPADSAAELASTLRTMMRGTVVTRGAEPLPVKTVLPLRLPEHLEEQVDQARQHSAQRPATNAMVTIAPADTDDEPDEFQDDPYQGPAYQEVTYSDHSYPEGAYQEATYRDDSYRAEIYPGDDGFADPPVTREPSRYRERSGPHAPPPRSVPLPPSEPGRPPGAYPPAASADRWTEPDDPWADSSAPHGTPFGGPNPPIRSIGFRRYELRSVPPRIPGPPSGHASDALPPVPAVEDWDTQGLPRLSAESTWSSASPVVSAAAVEHQPAWAQLSEAPSFWPDPYPTGPIGPPVPAALPMSPPPATPREPTPWRPPEPVGWAGLGGVAEHTGELAAVQPVGSVDPADPLAGIAPVWSEPLGDSARDIPTDSLHDALTSDAALSNGRLPRVRRRRS